VGQVCEIIPADVDRDGQLPSSSASGSGSWSGPGRAAQSPRLWPSHATSAATRFVLPLLGVEVHGSTNASNWQHDDGHDDDARRPEDSPTVKAPLRPRRRPGRGPRAARRSRRPAGSGGGRLGQLRCG